MIFGRGGGGGVSTASARKRISAPRTKSRFRAARSATSGSPPMSTSRSQKVAVRLNGMYEDSGSFRHDVEPRTRRHQPDAHDRAEARTQITLGYEHFRDDRDRRSRHHLVSGAPGRPSDRDVFTATRPTAHVQRRRHLASAGVEHRVGERQDPQSHAGSATTIAAIRTSCPAPSTPTQSQVTLTAYNNAHRSVRTCSTRPTSRTRPRPGGVGHTLLAGAEVGRQATDNFRNTGFFNNTRDVDAGAVRRTRRSARR